MTLKQWQSGTRSSVMVSACAGDLITVRVLRRGAAEEEVDAAYRPPHLIYAPTFGGGCEAGPTTVGGMAAPKTEDPLEYRVDLAPLWCPYDGQIFLDGGGGRGPVDYDLFFERGRRALKPCEDPTFTLRKVTGAVAMPRGAYAVSVPVALSLSFGPAAVHTFTVQPGQRFPLGSLAFGTVAPGGSDPVEALAFHVRF